MRPSTFASTDGTPLPGTPGLLRAMPPHEYASRRTPEGTCPG